MVHSCMQDTIPTQDSPAIRGKPFVLQSTASEWIDEPDSRAVLKWRGCGGRAAGPERVLLADIQKQYPQRDHISSNGGLAPVRPGPRPRGGQIAWAGVHSEQDVGGGGACFLENFSVCLRAIALCS